MTLGEIESSDQVSACRHLVTELPAFEQHQPIHSDVDDHDDLDHHD